MTATLTPPRPQARVPTLTELTARFGDMPANRFRLDRYPATEQDVIELDAHQDRLCELIDGILVEKAMGWRESRIASRLIFLLELFLETHDVGATAGEAGMLKLWPGRVRIPDVAFVLWSQFPGGEIQSTPIPSMFPDIAVEVLSESNTRKELKDKRDDYFKAGTRLVWIVDPDARAVEVYAPEAPHEPKTFGETDTVIGDPVLPGFSFLVGEIFKRMAK